MRLYIALVFLLFFVYFGCGEETSSPSSEPSYDTYCDGKMILEYNPVYMDVVSYYRKGEGINLEYADPNKAINGVRGAGEYSGSLDVVSLGKGGIIVLSSSKYVIKNGEGCDFKVFENPFILKGKEYPYYYMEVATVWISISPSMPDPEDDTKWIEFPVEYNPSALPGTKAMFLKGFAGINPVSFNQDCFRIDPRSDSAGGDCFDLQDLVNIGKISNNDVVYYIRLKDGGDEYDEKHSCCPPFDFDLDGIILLNYKEK